MYIAFIIFDMCLIFYYIEYIIILHILYIIKKANKI